MKSALEQALRDIVRKYDVMTYAFHILKALEDLGLVDQSIDRHAGEWETSIMLIIAPNLVGDKRIAERRIPSKFGVYGDPTKATREKGLKLLKEIIDYLEGEIDRNFRKGERIYFNWK